MYRSKLRYLVIGIMVVSLITYYYYSQIHGKGDIDYGDVDVEQARKLIDSKFSLVILDVRTQEEYDEGHLAGAKLIPLGELEARLGDFSKSDELLVYCRTGNRSSNAVSILKANGYTKIFHMAGGIVAWEQAGYPIVK